MRTMFALRTLAGSLAGLVAVTSPFSAFASTTAGTSVPKPSYATGNVPLDRMFSEYESAVRSRSDGAKLNAFLREAPGFGNRQISETLRDEILKSRIDSVKKSDLSRELPEKLATDSDRKSVLRGLVASMKKDSATYRVIARTSHSKSALVDALSVFGKTEASFLYSDGTKDTYEITFPNSGRYAKYL